jgi:hypothetical protein
LICEYKGCQTSSESKKSKSFRNNGDRILPRHLRCKRLCTIILSAAVTESIPVPGSRTVCFQMLTVRVYPFPFWSFLGMRILFLSVPFLCRVNRKSIESKTHPSAISPLIKSPHWMTMNAKVSQKGDQAPTEEAMNSRWRTGTASETAERSPALMRRRVSN